jgi:hypothetical protein
VNLRNVEGVTGEECDYKPKLVKLERSDPMEGYGFHLLYLDDRKGEYIEEVQARGLADRAGLRVGDRIIEVNGCNIETHRSRDVVNRIRTSPTVVTLLLVDPKTDGYFRKKAVTITTSLAEEFFDDRVGKVRKGKNKKDKSHIKPRYCRLVKAHKERVIFTLNFIKIYNRIFFLDILKSARENFKYSENINGVTPLAFLKFKFFSQVRKLLTK